MKELKVTNLSRFFALLLLYDKPRHGYELLKETGKGLGKKQSAGQVYPFLRLLQKQGYVSVGERGNRKKKVFELTASGKTFVKQLLRQFDSMLEAAVEPHLRKCSHCDCTLYDSGVEKIVGGKKRFFCCGNCAAAYLKR